MENLDSLPNKNKIKMEARLKKYKSEIKLNRLIFLFLILINLIIVMTLSFTGLAQGPKYTMDLNYVRICIALSVLTLILSIAPIIKSILDL